MIVIAAVVIKAGGLLRAEIDLVGQSGGRITSVDYVTGTGATRFNVHATFGVGESEGVQLACQLVEPILAGDGYPDAQFSVLDSAGDVLASDATPCLTAP